MEMKIPRTSIESLSLDTEAVAGLILSTQKPNGEIPWSPGDKTDPWDLVEAAMGLGIGGYRQGAERAYAWMAGTQLEDGSWYSSYRDGVPEDRTRDTNVSSYIAVGVLYHYLITGNQAFLKRMWPTVSAAIEFALGLQRPTGEIYWAISPEGKVDPMALLTGSSSIYLSIKCGLAIAARLGLSRPRWRASLHALGDAIRNQPHLFNITKARFSMDWFYPILCGAVTGDQAIRRIFRHWGKFVVKDRGVRCVSDRPWITIAETSELCITLAAMGNRKLSETVFGWIQDSRFEDGSYWCGYTFPDGVIWPEEKISWTNAAVLLAADALYHLTPASRLFSHLLWGNVETPEPEEVQESLPFVPAVGSSEHEVPLGFKPEAAGADDPTAKFD